MLLRSDVEYSGKTFLQRSGRTIPIDRRQRSFDYFVVVYKTCSNKENVKYISVVEMEGEYTNLRNSDRLYMLIYTSDSQSTFIHEALQSPNEKKKNRGASKTGNANFHP